MSHFSIADCCRNSSFRNFSFIMRIHVGRLLTPGPGKIELHMYNSQSWHRLWMQILEVAWYSLCTLIQLTMLHKSIYIYSTRRRHNLGGLASYHTVVINAIYVAAVAHVCRGLCLCLRCAVRSLSTPTYQTECSKWAAGRVRLSICQFGQPLNFHCIMS